VTCADCRFPFRCDAEHVPADNRVVCPNCGFQVNDLADARLAAGERVLIDSWPYGLRQPRRHEIVAGRDPLAAGELVVKRVAALPGEQLEIREGDLFANGQIVRKTPAQLRQVRVLVHDNDYQPEKSSGLPARWETRSSPPGWRAVSATLHHEPQGIVRGGDGFNRLEYRHWRCVAGPGDRTKGSPILDNDSYNQAESRELNVVRDVHLSCDLSLREPGRVALFVRANAKQFAAFVDPQRREVTLESLDADLRGTMLDREPLAIDLARTAVTVEFGLCDRQMLLAIDGRTTFLHAIDDSENEPLPATAIANQLEIWAGSSARVEIMHLRVWRDVYYLDPTTLARPWRADAPLAAGQFALLGDNGPVSIDSRHWPQTGISRASIMGRVYRPFWAATSTD
jgi:signal peptidase I